MKNIALLLVFACAAHVCLSQKIVNLVLLKEGEITENIKEATHFVLVKEMNGHFERHDYNMHGPLIKVRTYSDSNLSILNGWSYEYNAVGGIKASGRYIENKKDGDWFFYNDTAKVILKEKYENGVLYQTINPDTLIKDTTKFPDEKEASYKGGLKALRKFLISNLDGNAGLNSVQGGKVLVGFTINTEGKLVDIYLRKSVEYVLDNEALSVIYKMPYWEPAFQNGKHINAYRVQPITFVKE